MLQKILKKHQAANFDHPIFVFLHNFEIGAQVLKMKGVRSWFLKNAACDESHF